jgi:trypsin-like peptidase
VLTEAFSNNRKRWPAGTFCSSEVFLRIARYNETLKLRGLVTTEYHFGRPNYGQTPALDELERVPILLLDEPLTVLADGASGISIDQYTKDHEYVARVQLSQYVDFDVLRRLRGHGLEFEGRLCPRRSPHYFTDVILDLANAAPLVVDDRGTFAYGNVTGSGTGFLLGRRGIVITNEHVVRHAKGLTVTRGLRRSIAKLIHVNEGTDFAVLETDLNEDIDLRVRSWLWPQLGETVYVFGFPLRPILPHSLNMTAGMVSSEDGLGRTRFQISAPVQEGNSGGPVFDARGNVAGIVVSKLKPSVTGSPRPIFPPENVSYAISSLVITNWIAKNHFPIEQREHVDSVAPTELGKLAHRICVEVECWE